MSSQTLLPRVVLTPIKSYRKKRPSYSPAKYQPPLPATPTPKPRAMSEASSAKLPTVNTADNNLAMASLEFEEFSCRGVDNYFSTLSRDHLFSLLAYLGKEYRVLEVQQSGPFMILWCKDSVPEVSARPFTIAGCIAVWKTEDEDVPPEVLPRGLANGETLVIEPELAADLHLYVLPKADTLQSLTRYFPTAEFISYLNTGVIIELPQLPVLEHRERLENLPREFENARASLQYHNGPMARNELKRLRKPQPKYLDGVFDDTDYVKAEGCFYPGTMISSQSGNSVSAGILVEKAGESRLTVAFHCWDEESKISGKTLGNPQCFRVAQGDSKVGTSVGYLTDRIGNTDIGLVKLDVPFSNRFLEIDATPKTLLRSGDVKFYDKFVVDSFVTGFQRLICLGIRVRVEGARERTLKGKPESLPTPGTYVEVIQGIFATSAPEITSKPMIREGICGAALVRSNRGDITSGNSKELEKTSIAEGAIAGFMHWSDLQSRTQEENLLCYADSVDELIKDGWEVVQVAEKLIDT